MACRVRRRDERGLPTMLARNPRYSERGLDSRSKNERIVADLEGSVRRLVFAST